MRATALVQPTSANAMVFPLALTLEALLFSLALASRIQDLKQERALALDQADQEKNARLALLHSAQRDLARAVEVRTNELSEANRQLQMREAQLQYAAHHDPLTGLGNRRHLMEFAESALDDARRHGNSMALLLIDLDHFKPINDTHGTMPATSSCRTWPSGCAIACAPRIAWRASAATNSPCWSAGRMPSSMPATSPNACCENWRNRWSSPSSGW